MPAYNVQVFAPRHHVVDGGAATLCLLDDGTASCSSTVSIVGNSEPELVIAPWPPYEDLVEFCGARGIVAPDAYAALAVVLGPHGLPWVSSGHDGA